MDLLYDIQEGVDYNLIFLDIIMDELNGSDVAYKIRETDTKPLSRTKAFSILDKVINIYETQKYPIHKNSAITYVPIDKILYVESDNSRCILHQKDGDCCTVYKKLDTIQAELPSSHFLRCHKSFLVNMDYIQSVDKEFTLVTGDVVAIRQRSLKDIRAQYLEYISKWFRV